MCLFITEKHIVKYKNAILVVVFGGGGRQLYLFAHIRELVQ
jgi:hypothetical protein